MSEVGWGRPHTSSDMETAPLVEVAYSILVGSLIRWSNFTGAEMYLFRLGLQSESELQLHRR